MSECVYNKVTYMLGAVCLSLLTSPQAAPAAPLDPLTQKYMWATIVGVVGAWVGLGILIIQTIVTRRTAQRQLRAYVLSDSSTIFNVANPVPLYPGQQLAQTDARITNTAAGPGAVMQIKNTGQTPAFKIRHWGYICLREYPLAAALPAPLPITGNAPTTILGPGQIAIKLLDSGPPLTTQQITDLRNGVAAIYVFGEIKYEDAFRVARITRYRVMHHRSGGTIGVSTGLLFCDDGNDAT